MSHADFPKKNMKAKVAQRDNQPENSDRLTMLMDKTNGVLAAAAEFQDKQQRIVVKSGVTEAKIADILKIHDFHYIQKVMQHISKL